MKVFEYAAGAEGRQHGVEEDGGSHDGGSRVDEGGDQLADHRRAHGLQGEAVHEAVVDICFRHVQGHIGEGPDDGGEQGAIKPVPPLCGNVHQLAAHPRHGELADKGDDHVDEIIACKGVV